MSNKFNLKSAIVLSLVLRLLVWHIFSSREPNLSHSSIPFFFGFETKTLNFEHIYEAFFRASDNKNPFSGSVFSGSPFLFLLLHPLSRLNLSYSSFRLCCLLTVFLSDVISALSFAALKRKTSSGGGSSATLAALFILNPFSIANSVSVSFGNFHYSFALSALLAAYHKQKQMAFFLMSFCILLDLHSVMFLPVLILYLQSSSKEKTGRKEILRNCLGSVFFVTGYCLLFLLYAREVFGGWHFIKDTYFDNIKSENINPNPDLFWYFFSLVFDRFRPIFIILFNTHFVLVSIPLSIVIGKDRFFLTAVLRLLSLVFRPTPLFSDFIEYTLTLYSIREHLKHTRYTVLLLIMAVFALSAQTIFWYFNLTYDNLNLNYIHTYTLLYNLFVSYAIVDIVYSHVVLMKDAKDKNSKNVNLE